MGFYVRKTLRSGPFRFTASTSGLGVSAGVPGFRAGTGPRGNYVSVSAGGLNYRTTRAQSRRPTRASPPTRTSSQHDVEMEDVTGATIHELVATGRGDIVEQLNDAAAYRSWTWPIFGVLFLAGLAIASWGWLLSGAALVALVYLVLRDQAKRRVIVFYDVEGADERWFDSLVDSTTVAAASQKVWRIVESGQVVTTRQHKTNAGAGNLVSRVSATVTFDAPRHLATNIAVPTITAGHTSLHFLPDRILVKEGRQYADVAYGDLVSGARSTQFIEALGGLPTDAQQVDRTWQYVNVKGGPDRRYSNNPERAVMLYGQLEMSSPGGLYWKVQTSAVSATNRLHESLRAAPRH
ncbi:DUF4236 domain-containing protein [Frigoribacterium sp. NBH87]|nr:DUF4236 domain-containing protein [Frigoribacterium sp. NBH87]